MFSKAVITGLLSLVSTVALAYPALGDKAEWTGSEDKADGTSTPWMASKEVTAWDAATMMWTVKVDMTKGDQTTSETIMTKCLWTPEAAAKMMAMCAEEGGTVEQITVMAGTYDTCRMTMVGDDGRVFKKWMGDVPFGVVKKEMTDLKAGVKSHLELSKVTAGQ